MAKRRKNVHGFYYAVRKKDFADISENGLPEDDLYEKEDVLDISKTARLDNPEAFEKVIHTHYPESDDEPVTKIHGKRLVDLPVSQLNEMYADTDEGLPLSGGDIAKMENQAIPVRTYETGLMSGRKGLVRDVSRLRSFMDAAFDRRRKPEYGNDLADPEHNEY